MGQFYTIRGREPKDASTPDGNAASTSNSIDQEFLVVNPVVSSQEELPPGVSREPCNLKSLETIQLRRIETMTEESLISRITRLEVHINSCRSRELSCEKWATTHEAQLTWAKDKVNEAWEERDELRATIEELSDRITELTARLDKGKNQNISIDRICTFPASNFRA